MISLGLECDSMEIVVQIIICDVMLVNIIVLGQRTKMWILKDWAKSVISVLIKFWQVKGLFALLNSWSLFLKILFDRIILVFNADY